MFGKRSTFKIIHFQNNAVEFTYKVNSKVSYKAILSKQNQCRLFKLCWQRFQLPYQTGNAVQVLRYSTYS